MGDAVVSLKTTLEFDVIDLRQNTTFQGGPLYTLAVLYGNVHGLFLDELSVKTGDVPSRKQ